MVQAIFFDLFETLITEFSDGKRISKRNYDYKALLGIEFHEFKKAWSSRSSKRMTGAFKSFPDVIKDILTEKALPISEEAIAYLYQERMKEKAILFRTISTDIIELLQSLRSQNINLGLISNCTEEEVRGWHDSELAPYFDHVIFSYDVGIAKPEASIYRLACEALQVTPEQSIFVGDGGSNELQGAADAGMLPYHATWFNATINSPFRKFNSPSALASEIIQTT